MLWVVGWWVLAMVSGLCWARPYTAALAAATLLVALWTRAVDLTASAGWVQLAVLGITPWLLAAQRAREGEAFRRLHQEEAAQLSRLSSTARSLLSLQSAMQQMDTQIA